MHTLKILKTYYISHDVKQIALEKPKDFIYRPGQSAHISVNIPGWEDQIRPFTFTSLNDWPFLEFTIKIYEERQGVTSQIGRLEEGQEILLHDVFGTIEYKGSGVFLAGGTGITPFIAILRALYLTGNIRNIGLIYSNKSQSDIILHDELKKILGKGYIDVFTRQGVIGFRENRIDKKFLAETIHSFDSYFYVCGPKSFTKDLTKDLIELGAKPQSVII